jgi:hypothetical protein
MSSNAEAAAYGTAELTPRTDVVAGSFGTWTITYTVGPLGMDDGSTLKVVSEMATDWGPPQFDRPGADNYSSVHTSGDATVTASHDPRGYVRPWTNAVVIDISEGTLDSGDTITLVLGDRSRGSRGVQTQSFVENGFEFRVVVDVFETGEFMRVPGELTFDVVGGEVTTLEAIAPSSVSPGERFDVRVRARDRWGNVTDEFTESLRCRTDNRTLPRTATPEDGVATLPVTLPEEGVHRVHVRSDSFETTTNPVVCREGETSTYWGDIHGQSEETVGTGSINEYFAFGREKGFLDFAAPANHDFQLTDDFWDRVREAVHEANDPGEFVTFLSYEWSANTPAGGDHNVYFRDDAEDIERVSNWQVKDDDEDHEGVFPIEELYDTYDGRDDVFIIPHQGGRPASPDVLDPDRTPFIEIASLWGVFEWFAHEALDSGYPVGFVAGSDDTAGRLGATFPSTIDWHHVKGGLMAVQADALDRETLWNAFRDRRVYATTGARILLDVRVDGEPMGGEVEVESTPRVSVSANGTGPVGRIDLFRGSEMVAGRDATKCDEYVELVWTGLHSKNRRKHVDWSGTAQLTRGRISDVEPFGFNSPDQGVTEVTSSSVAWTGMTVGNYQGVRMRVDAPDDAVLSINTPQVETAIRAGDLSDEHVEDAGHLGKRLTVRPTGEPVDTDVETTFSDEAAPAGTHPYYVRVRQVDGEMAWSSPIFVTVP